MNKLTRSGKGDRTAGSARMRAARPAVQLQDASDLGGDPAWLLGHVRPVVSERDDACLHAGVVPVDVTPAGLGRMRDPAIEFHGNPKLTVAIVQVAGPLADVADGLPSRAGEPMRPFNAVNIAPLQYRVDAVADISEGRGQLRAPAKPGPGRHGGEQDFGGGQPAPTGGDEPRQCLVNVRGSLNEGEGRLFDPGTGRRAGGVTRLAEATQGMNDDPWDPAPTLPS